LGDVAFGEIGGLGRRGKSYIGSFLNFLKNCL
jgi:hypothetical protein